jgi:hypothetical protein
LQRAGVGLAIVAIGQGTGPPIRLRCVIPEGAGTVKVLRQGFLDGEDL